MSLYRTVEEKQWIWMNRDEEESSNRVELPISLFIYMSTSHFFFQFAVRTRNGCSPINVSRCSYIAYAIPIMVRI